MDVTVQLAPQRQSSALVLRVALVDNRDERRQLMRRVVEAGPGKAVVVCEAESGARAIAMVDEQQVDAAIVEVQMPVKDGLGVVADLRQRYPDLGIIVCSFHVDQQTQERAHVLGADAYLAKPIRPRELDQALHRATAAHPQPITELSERPEEVGQIAR